MDLAELVRLRAWRADEKEIARLHRSELRWCGVDYGDTRYHVGDRGAREVEQLATRMSYELCKPMTRAPAKNGRSAATLKAGLSP